MESSSEKNLNWYAAYVRHQNEYKIAKLFRRMFGINVCVPSRKIWRKRGKRVEVITRPLLKTYVFFQVELEDKKWTKIFMADGVIDVVRQMGKPAVIPRGQIATLRRLGNSSLVVHEIEYTKLKPHDMVEVVQGPMKGAQGYFIKSDETTGKFIVRLDLFQRALETEVDASFVRPL